MIKLQKLLKEIEDHNELSSKVKSLEIELYQKFPQLENLHLYIQSNGTLFVGSIKIKLEFRRQGIGKNVMREIKHFADKHNVTIVLSPEPDRGYKDKLNRFYRDLGFIPNQGRKKDYSLSSFFGKTMYYKPKQKEAMDIQSPPAIVKPEYPESFDKSFLNYIKSVENETKIGYDKNKKLWFPHKSVEGGFPTIGYGHKIKSNHELETIKNGISDKDVENLLKSDLMVANKRVREYIKNKYKVDITLTQKQNEMLIDFAFNLGGLEKFPKFVDAVLKNQWDIVKSEYIRNVGGKSLTGRNKSFFNRYLKSL